MAADLQLTIEEAWERRTGSSERPGTDEAALLLRLIAARSGGRKG
jgi:hypothetical protein